MTQTPGHAKGARGGGHVVLITTYFWPEQTGVSQTASELAFFLAERGIAVRVVTGMPFYPQWRIWPGYRRALWRTEIHNGVTIYRSWHLVRPRPSTITRILHEVTLSVFATLNMVRALAGAGTAVVAVPDLSYAFVGTVLSVALRIRVVLVVYDLQPDAAVELGMMQNRAMIRLARWMARVVYRLADEIHTLSEGMRRRIARDAGGPTKVRLVPITVDPGELAPVPVERNEFCKRFVPPGTFSILHTGNMGRKQDLDLLLRAAHRLRSDPTVRFYVFGDGAVKDAFLEQRAELRLSNIEHYGLQERDILPHMLSGANLVLVSQRAEVAEVVVPSKLITAMCAGAMVVAACSDDSEPARLVRESGGGVVIPAGNDEALAEVISRLRRGLIDARDCRERARLFAVSHFGREAVYGPLALELGAVDPGDARNSAKDRAPDPST